MPTYEFICHDCKIIWDKEASIKKAPKKSRCPECNSLCDKNWEAHNPNISFNDDGFGNKRNGAMDFHTVKQRYRKFAEKGYDKDSAERFYRTSIEASKERIQDERGRYKTYDLDCEELVKQGKATWASEREVYKKREHKRKLTEDAVQRANNMGYNLDIATGKPKKQ